MVITMFISLILFISHGDMACDDSYIHDRVALHMSLYGLPYFDLSQPLMISTSIMWTLLLSILHKLPGELFLWIEILNALIVSIISLLWCQLNNTNNYRAYWLAFIFTLCSIHIAAIDQMETPFACMVLFLCLWICKTKRFLILGLLLTILPFIRPELVLISFLLGVYCFKNYKQTRLGILICVFVLSTIIYWLIYMFGTVVPHAIEVKSIVYDIEFSQTLYDLLPGRENWSLVFRLLPLLVLMKLFNLNLWSKLIGIYIFLLWVAYTLKGTFIFSWYPSLIHCPLLFIAFNLCLKNYKYLIIVLCLNLPFLFEFYLTCTNKYRYSLRSARVQTYLKLSKVISRYTDEKSRLMVAEIGAISKYYSGIILDGVGLATPEALKYHPLRVPDQRAHGSIGAIPKKFFEDTKPDLVIGYDLFILGISKSEKLQNYYVIPLPLFANEWIHKLDNQSTFWGSRHLYLFIRRDFANASNLVKDLQKF